MGKRKMFVKNELGVLPVEHSLNTSGKAEFLPETIPPVTTIIQFERNATNRRSFDFARWYGAGIDLITYACQRQIERFLAGQDGVITVTTVTGYCSTGLRHFLDYCLLRASAFGRDLVLVDVNRDLIDGYLGYLTRLGMTPVSQRNYYLFARSVLLALAKRELIPLVAYGDAATFPRNPFPNCDRLVKGETALSKHERQSFTMALRQAIKPVWSDDVPVTAELLAYILLVVALHTGRNTTPLLEMGRNCLHPHPKDNTVFLVLWKRRGYNISVNTG